MCCVSSPPCWTRGLTLNHIKNPASSATFYSDSQRLESLCNKPSYAHQSETSMITFFNLVAKSPLFCSPSPGKEGALKTYYAYCQKERGQRRLQTAPPPFFLKSHWSTEVNGKLDSLQSHRCEGLKNMLRCFPESEPETIPPIHPFCLRLITAADIQ